MISRWYSLIGCIAILIASAAHADDRIVSGVPLPDSIAIQTVSDSVPYPARSFSGAWIGSWGGSLHHVLIVEAVQSNGAGEILYAIAGAPANHIRRMWARLRATIVGDTLTVEGISPITYTIEPSGSLQATYRQGGIRSYARMSRISLRDLYKSDAALDWSEPTTIFVDGPADAGSSVRLETVLFKPRGQGPFPLLVFNHGSTGRGRDPALFTRTYWNFGLADFFVSRGWMVAFPQRRGRGQSDGLYDEGFNPDRREGYSCDAAISLRGSERALADVEASIAALRRRNDVEGRSILIGGISRGGALSIAFAGRHPKLISGVINFVGGWLGTGCGTATEVNGELFRKGGQYHRPTLWIYGKNDAFYSIGHSRSNFDLFRNAGGEGRFVALDVPGGEGHKVASHRALWLDPVTTYLTWIGQSASP